MLSVNLGLPVAGAIWAFAMYPVVFAVVYGMKDTCDPGDIFMYPLYIALVALPVACLKLVHTAVDQAKNHDAKVSIVTVMAILLSSLSGVSMFIFGTIPVREEFMTPCYDVIQKDLFDASMGLFAYPLLLFANLLREATPVIINALYGMHEEKPKEAGEEAKEEEEKPALWKIIKTHIISWIVIIVLMSCFGILTRIEIGKSTEPQFLVIQFLMWPTICIFTERTAWRHHFKMAGATGVRLMALLVSFLAASMYVFIAEGPVVAWNLQFTVFLVTGLISLDYAIDSIADKLATCVHYRIKWEVINV